MTSTEMNEMHQSASIAPSGETPRVVRREVRVAEPGVLSRAVRAEARVRELKRSPYPPVVGTVVRQLARVQVAAWDRALRDVQRVQEAQLSALLDHARDTEFGRAHGFGRIRGYEDFVRQVPVGDYDSFSPYIDRMRKGEQRAARPGVRAPLR